jgi:hypothetical protein
MAIAQDNFDVFRSKAFEGQVASIEVCKILSRMVEGDFIPFGRAVIRGAGRRSCAPVTEKTVAADIIGFTVRSMAQSSPTMPNEQGIYASGYRVDYVASILEDGPIKMLCVDGALAGDAAEVVVTAGDTQGCLTAGGKGVELNMVRWVDDVEAGAIGEIRVHGLLSIEAGAATAP